MLLSPDPGWKHRRQARRGVRAGGPATAGEGWIEETLAHCAEQGLPLDFVQAISGGVKSVRARIDRSAFPRVELHYTEWSSSDSPSAPFHDSYHSVRRFEMRENDVWLVELRRP